MSIFHWSILFYVHKWLKIFDFTEYSKDWEKIILGGGPESRQWKGKTVKSVSIFT